LSFESELIQRAWSASVASMGTTGLAIGGGLLYPLAGLGSEFRKRGWKLEVLTQHWKDRLRNGFLIALIWWSVLFSYQLSAVSRQIRLQAEETVVPSPNRPMPPNFAYANTEKVAIIPSTPTLAASTAFAVAIETKILTFGPTDISHIGFWVLDRTPNNCFLFPADTVIFIRIKNLRKIKTMITAYNVYGVGGELVRLRTDINRPFLILTRGVLKPSTQGSIPFSFPVPVGNLGSLVKFPLKDADPSVAAPIEGEFWIQR
jgi:hypothetical protein